MSPGQPCACTVDRRHAQQQASPRPSAHCRTRPFPALDTASPGRSHGTFRAGCGPTKQRPSLEPLISGGGDHSRRVPQQHRIALWGCLAESSGTTWSWENHPGEMGSEEAGLRRSQPGEPRGGPCRCSPAQDRREPSMCRCLTKRGGGWEGLTVPARLGCRELGWYEGQQPGLLTRKGPGAAPLYPVGPSCWQPPS